MRVRTLRWYLGLACLVLGAACFWLAWHIEGQVRYALGTGTVQGIAYLLYREDIHAHRRSVAWLALYGPALWLAAWWILPRRGVAAVPRDATIAHAATKPSSPQSASEQAQSEAPAQSRR